eukprot:3434218-Pyramimonas_sp.AAC.1
MVTAADLFSMLFPILNDGAVFAPFLSSAAGVFAPPLLLLRARFCRDHPASHGVVTTSGGCRA